MEAFGLLLHDSENTFQFLPLVAYYGNIAYTLTVYIIYSQLFVTFVFFNHEGGIEMMGALHDTRSSENTFYFF